MSEERSDGCVEALDEEFVIIQPAPGTGYRFTSDAISLAKFVYDSMPKGGRVLDLCSGCGIIGTVLNIEGNFRSVGVELDERLYAMSVRAAAANEMGKEVTFVRADVRGFGTRENVAELGRFDAVLCNPPYYKADSRPAAVAPEANSELTVTFADIVRTAEAFLTQNGEFYTVHISSRLDEVLGLCRDRGLTPKTLQLNPNGKTFLLRCVRGGKPGLDVRIAEFKCFT